MTGLCTTNGFMLGLKGVPDYNYVIEASYSSERPRLVIRVRL
jgi:hypothetical protein